MRLTGKYSEVLFFCSDIKNQLTRSVAFLLVFSCAQLSVHAAERSKDRLIISAGQIGILDNLHSDSFALEYRFASFTGPYDLQLIPMIGVLTASNGSNYFYGGLSYDFYINPEWLLVPSFAVGQFRQSSEINLGNDLEFKSGIELAYQFQNHYRTSVAVYHLSNGGISESNSGTEVVTISLGIPL